MKARIKNFIIDAEPMTKFEYYNVFKKIPYQDPNNKFLEGYLCNWKGFTFWLDKFTFNFIYTIEND